ncbi:MAG: GIY-YIG nuclease family protein [Candidatus Bathyarchaeum sp.]|nr:MAG: GIY-YIG nuclease family protein [Candidatus Bathyarchaeum sp.]
MKEDITLIPELSTTGVYTLLLFLPKEVNLNIGKLGKKRFPEGHYTYTGSALGKGATSLKHRIARHLRRKKRRFWHIDYLLANENVSVKAVIVAETKENMECNMNQYLKKVMGAKVPVKGFGASDCRKNCGSHLLYFPEIEKADFLVQRIVKYLRSSSGYSFFFSRFRGMNNKVKKTPARNPPT